MLKQQLQKTQEELNKMRIADIGNDGNLYIHLELLQNFIRQAQIDTVKTFADEVKSIAVEALFDDYGFWRGVCDCCTGFDSDDDAVKEHLIKQINNLLKDI